MPRPQTPQAPMDQTRQKLAEIVGTGDKTGTLRCELTVTCEGATAVTLKDKYCYL